jgi:hypothetical protein
MTESPPGLLTSTAVSNDVSEQFLFSTKYRDDPNLLTRAGSITIVPTNGPPQHYGISLLDRLFRNNKRPLRPEPPAIINMDREALFATVQECRTRWEEAISSAMGSHAGAGNAGSLCRYAYEEKWKNPVNTKTFRAIVGKLAVAGAAMFESIFESNRDTPLDEIAQKLRDAARSGTHALTVTAIDFHLPWRMLYTHPTPNEPLNPDGTNFIPRGFWGYQHIIEEFINNHPVEDHVTANGGKLALGAALHNNIDTKFQVACLATHRDFAQCNGKQLSYVEWTNKADATTGLKGSPFLRAVYFLCHAEVAGKSDRPSLDQPVLQLTDGAIKTTEIRLAINHRFGGSPPLVFVNACRGGQLGTTVAHNFSFANEFLEQGVACLIGPQIEVPAVFAGEFGKCFFERLLQRRSPPPLAGVILRDVTQYMWKQRNPLGLVYSLYAGADCHIKWPEELPI